MTVETPRNFASATLAVRDSTTAQTAFIGVAEAIRRPCRNCRRKVRDPWGKRRRAWIGRSEHAVYTHAPDRSCRRDLPWSGALDGRSVRLWPDEANLPAQET